MHCLAARVNQSQAGFEVDRLGKNQRGVFSQAQSGYGCALLDELGRFLSELLGCGKAAYEQGRLAVHGGVQLFGGTLEAEAGQVVAEDLAGTVIKLTGRGMR